jgi:hypothetical protein
MKGMKSNMNPPYRSDSIMHSVACMGFLASVPAHLERTERKVARRDRIGAILALCCSFASVMAGCSNTSHMNATPQTPLISVALTQAPASMITGNSALVSAMVTNDPADAGVDWVATCASAPKCGTFTPSHTASGATSIYTAPPGVPTKNTVAVTALSTTDRSKSSATTVNITSTVTSTVITTPLPGSLPAGAIVNLGATVSGDPANLGVDWTLTCPLVEGPVVCGSNIHSNSGVSVPFVIPQTVIDPLTNQTVSVVGTTITITAFATADPSHYAIYYLGVTAPLSISITQAPPATLLTNATAQVIAVVANDTSNAGVTWLVKCDQAPCGTISPTQTASGVAATFTAPPTVPSPNPAPGLAVTIFAFPNAAVSGNGTPNLITSVTVNIDAPISVSITTGVTNNTIAQNAGAPLVATVTNDAGNAGVDWSVLCGSTGACGTFSPTHTASGVATTYTAPAAPPTPDTVTIMATSSADHTTNAQQIVIVTAAPPPNTLLQGQFVLFLSAKNSKNGPFMLGGVISGAAAGGSTTNGSVSGRLDLADAAGNALSSNLLVLDPGPYSIGLDGRGQIQLTLETSNLSPIFGVPATSTTSTLTLSVVFVTPQHALLTEIDAFGDATGTIDAQNAADLNSFVGGTEGLNGTYSLQLTGVELAPSFPGFFVAAAITSQASNFTYTFTGHTADQSANGAITSVPFTASSQSFSNTRPGSGGAIFFDNVDLGLPKTFSLDLWLIDANHFVVTDFVNATSAPFVLVGGYLTFQPTSPSLSGTLAFTEAGATTSPSATAPGQPQVTGGILTCGSTGSVDVVTLGGTPLTAQPVTAACTPPANGNGRGAITITGAGSTPINFAAYPTLDRGFYLIELDGGTDGTLGPSGAGVAYPQTLPTPILASALSGNYASQFSATTQAGSQAFTGQIFSDGTSTIHGTVDVNSFTTSPAPGTGSPSPSATLSGSLTAGTGGRFPLMFTIAGQPSPQIPTLNPACYIVDASTCLLLGTDPSAPGAGILQLQNTGL